MALDKILIVFAVGLLNQVIEGQQFTPGCSFFNGQCVYNVQLGDSQSCDQTGKREIGESCSCNDVTKVTDSLNNLQTVVDRLEKSMMDFKKQLFNNTIQTSTNQGQQNLENQKYLNLLKNLHTKDDLLNRTNEEVAKVLKTASTEIENLQAKLKDTTSQLATCQKSNGITNTQMATNTNYTTFYCNFQHSDLCGFSQDHDDDNDWKRQSGSSSSNTGPQRDHTYGNNYGYYMVLNTRDTTKYSSGKTTSRITSSTFQPAQNYCIRFWYTMYGRDVDELNIYAKVHGGRGYPIFTVKNNVDRYWHLAQIDLGQEYTKTSFQISIEASHNAYKVRHYSNGRTSYTYTHEYGDIAVDDFYVYNTSCNNILSHPKGSVLRIEGNETSYYSFHKPPMTWYNAQDACRKENVLSTLATIKSSSEQTFIENVINSDVGLTVAGQNGFYINGNDIDSEGHFKWTDTGYPEDLGYANFYPGQPNNVGSNQDCLLMEYPAYNYQWGDVACTETHPFICETMVP